MALQAQPKPLHTKPPVRQRRVMFTVSVVALCLFLLFLANFLVPIEKSPSANGSSYGSSRSRYGRNKEVKPYRSCLQNYTDFMPCYDPAIAVKFPKERNIFRERHCPAQEDRLRCLIPPPPGYKTPIPWPQSKNQVWFDNVPFTKIADNKANKGWMERRGDRWHFPGGGSMFPEGVEPYVEKIAQYVPLAGGSVRTALDVGSGVASFGAALLSRDILTMSIAPKDSNKGQIQIVLERGLPALVGLLGTIRLPFPARAFDLAHCSKCTVPWHDFNGTYLLEMDRVLRGGAVFVLSSPYVGKAKDARWSELQQLARRMCWIPVAEDGSVAIWRKPRDHRCQLSRKRAKKPSICKEQDNPEAGWYVKLRACISRMPVHTGPDTDAPEVPSWPGRLHAPPSRMPHVDVLMKRGDGDRTAGHAEKLALASSAAATAGSAGAESYMARNLPVSEALPDDSDPLPDPVPDPGGRDGPKDDAVGPGAEGGPASAGGSAGGLGEVRGGGPREAERTPEWSEGEGDKGGGERVGGEGEEGGGGGGGVAGGGREGGGEGGEGGEREGGEGGGRQDGGGGGGGGGGGQEGALALRKRMGWMGQHHGAAQQPESLGLPAGKPGGGFGGKAALERAHDDAAAGSAAAGAGGGGGPAEQGEGEEGGGEGRGGEGEQEGEGAELDEGGSDSERQTAPGRRRLLKKKKKKKTGVVSLKERGGKGPEKGVPGAGASGGSGGGGGGDSGSGGGTGRGGGGGDDVESDAGADTGAAADAGNDLSKFSNGGSSGGSGAGGGNAKGPAGTRRGEEAAAAAAREKQRKWMVADDRRWARRVRHYQEMAATGGALGGSATRAPAANGQRARNVLDMNAGLGGFAAALAAQQAGKEAAEVPRKGERPGEAEGAGEGEGEGGPLASWVMNVVPTSEPNTLPVIFDRGLLGVYHDWCEAFSTYPRSFDLIHAAGMQALTAELQRCSLADVLLEMDRILRPGGIVLLRGMPRFLGKVERLCRAMRWTAEIVRSEEGKEQILVAKKLTWTLEDEAQYININEKPGE
eukprot:jgi/Mesen1/3350/ME000191S02483